MNLFELYSRNWLFIPDEIQKDLATKKLFFAGCGLNSKIIETAARTGFQKFEIWDKDIVDLSNLNRQNFYNEDLGKNKAKITSERIKSINPKIEVLYFEEFLTDENFSSVAGNADLVFNTIDFGDLFIRMTIKIIDAGVPVILPLNVGFGCVVIVFRDSDLLRNALGTIRSEVDMYEWLLSNGTVKLPTYINFEEFVQSRSKIGYDPQLAIAANLVSGFSITLAIKIFAGEKVKEFPDINYFDAKDYK